LREAWRPFALYEADAERVREVYDLTPGRQIKIGLRSAPHYVHRLMAAHGVLARFGLQRIAPFYDEGEGLRINTPSHGLLMPAVRRGLWRALLHYRSADNDAPRWVTSARLPNGGKAKPSIHVVNAGVADGSGVAVLVSHALEAEAMGASGVTAYAALNGASPPALALQLREQWPGLRAVVTATAEPVPAHARALRLSGLVVKDGGDE
jgi:hypothetical protein